MCEKFCVLVRKNPDAVKYGKNRIRVTAQKAKIRVQIILYMICIFAAFASLTETDRPSAVGNRTTGSTYRTRVPLCTWRHKGRSCTNCPKMQVLTERNSLYCTQHQIICSKTLVSDVSPTRRQLESMGSRLRLQGILCAPAMHTKCLRGRGV